MPQFLYKKLESKIYKLKAVRGFTLSQSKGFTLVEMLVAVAIFSVVMVIALGALLALSEADRKAQTLSSTINNLSFGLESMSRTIRTGIEYHCGSGGIGGPQDCGSPGNFYTSAQPYLSFIVADGSLSGCTPGVECQVAFCLSSGGSSSCNAGTVCSPTDSCSILRSVNGSAFAPLTVSELNVTNLGFYVKGAPAGDNIQPKVTLLLSGYVPVSATQRSTFSLQTSITQRLYDQ